MIFTNQNKDLLTLARWLGPWASEAAVPSGISRQEHHHCIPKTDQKVKVWTYLDPSRPPSGAYLLGPGLHFKGAEHEGLDRFARILAKAGHLVVSPFIPDYSDMHIQPDTHLPFLGAFDGLLKHEHMPRQIKPGVFSISFGSWLAMKLATCTDRSHKLGASVIFGGYGNFREAVDFAITGQIDGKPYTHHDPRNVPAIYMHIADTFGLDESVLKYAWLKFMQETWQIDSMRTQAACNAKAKELAKEIPKDFHETFLEGCGVIPGAAQRIRETLADESYDYLDTRSDFRNIKCPILIMHGTDDDVIPYTQLETLSKALPRHVHQERYLTGLYGHSSQDGQAKSALIKAAYKELRTMKNMLAAIYRGGRMPL